MSRSIVGAIVPVMSLGLALGCSEKQAEPVVTEQHFHEKQAAEKNTEINVAFAELSAADRKAAETQKICPVSNQALGSMGTPIKVVVADRQLFVCCEGCVDKAKENFDEYYAQLGGAGE
jgi:hypothetical protein